MGKKPSAVKKVIEGDGPHPDGRRERSRASRKSIIEAMMDLIAEGDINPSAASVAERAGVGLRSVFRHFDDKESIFREMDKILWDAYVPGIVPPFRSEDWRDQLFEPIERRSKVYEVTAPFRISTSVQRFQSPALAENYERLIKGERSLLNRILPDHIKRDSDRGRAIVLVTGFDAWRHFRQDEELSGTRTVEVIKQLLQDIRPDRGLAMVRSIVLAALLLGSCSDAGGDPTSLADAAKCTGLSEAGMVWIEGGTFTMGEDPLYPEEGPPRSVAIDGFWIGKTEVTNAQFARFVEETGYVTLAERDPPQIPAAPPEMLRPGAATFRVPTSENRSWWAWVPGAQWRNPSGPGSAIAGRENDPVVQIAFKDAQAYADWAGMSLPNEAQWEYAARAGAKALPQPLDGDGKPQANYYQGVFPARDLGEDGFISRAPVGCFEPNEFGLHDMLGNVWEWTSSEAGRPGATEPVHVIKGGSFLCAANYCARYRPAARQFQERGLGTDHIGFRLVDVSRPPPES